MIGTHQMGDARTWLLGIVAAAALLAAACGGGDSVKILEFELEANDGFRFVAELTDDTDLDGETWVLLGHQFTGNRRDWDGLRDELIEAGFTVLTWDFRCHGESPCETDTKGESVFNIWREWHAAIDYAVEQGAPKMYGIGASMGGTSVLQVAADRPELQAVAAVSPADFTFKGLDARTNYDQLTAPKFFIVGRTNASAPDFSRRYHERATGPSRIVVLETDLHGATLVKSEDFGAAGAGPTCRVRARSGRRQRARLHRSRSARARRRDGASAGTTSRRQLDAVKQRRDPGTAQRRPPEPGRRDPSRSPRSSPDGLAAHR